MRKKFSFIYKFIMIFLFFLCLINSKQVFSADLSEEYYMSATNYLNGENGFVKNIEEAKKLFIKAAKAGHIEAQNILGYSYLSGENGFPKDQKTAVIWLKKAAEAGNSHSQLNLFYCYNEGWGGLKKDRKQVKYWHEKIIENDKEGYYINRLANSHYFNNNKYKVNDHKIKDMLILAAKRGHDWAQFDLAENFYERNWAKNNMFTQNKLQAIYWYKKSALQGNEYAIKALKQKYGITKFEGKDPDAFPELFKCPQIEYPLVQNENKLESGMVFYDNRKTIIYAQAECRYENDITITPHWTIYPDPSSKSAKFHCNKGFGVNDNDEPDIYIEDHKRSIHVSSVKALSSVYIDLSKKEFKKQNHQKWIDLAKKLLPFAEKRGMSCIDSETDSKPKTNQKKDTNINEQPKTNNEAIKTKENKSDPQSWDDWEAPSPKAK